MEGIASETQYNIKGRQKRKNDVLSNVQTARLNCSKNIYEFSEDETKSLQTDGTSNSYFKVFSLAEVKDRGMQSAYSVFWSSVRRYIYCSWILFQCVCVHPHPLPLSTKGR